MNQQPFRNLKFCSTSVPSDIRLEMVSKIKAMGGEHFSHLMSDVDVLIVGDRDTDKYRYTVQNRLDIRMVRPKSIYTVYEKWVSGDAAMDLTLEDVQLPVFDAMNVCISRITDPLTKRRVVQELKLYSGNVTDSLTINNSCVIATEKSGKRYDKAVEWGIPVVHPGWVFDSVKRGASLDFKYYDIDKVDAQHVGEGACSCWAAVDQIRQLRLNKKRSVLEDDQERTVKIRKRQDTIWNNIMGSVRNPAVVSEKRDSWGVQETASHTANGVSGGLPGGLSGGVLTKNSLIKVNLALESDVKARQSPLFEGLCFGVAAFVDRSQVDKLDKVIRSHNGQVLVEKLLENTDRLTHILVPSTRPICELDPALAHLARARDIVIVTEWFIERSLHYNRICQDLWGAPLKHLRLNLNLKVAISGFTGVELLHLTKLIRSLGCEYCETLTSKRDLLVINLAVLGLNLQNSPHLFGDKYRELLSSPDSNKAGITSTKNKINACKKWSIPIVSMAFLMEASEMGQVPELLDPRWCIYLPASNTTSSSTTFGAKPGAMFTPPKTESIQVKDSANSLHIPKLPSPLKKKKKNWGRLIGRAQESQMGREFFEQGGDGEEGPGEESEFLDAGPVMSTQISYNDDTSREAGVLRRETRNQVKELNEL